MNRALIAVLVVVAGAIAYGQVLQAPQSKRFHGPIVMDGSMTLTTGPLTVDGGVVTQSLATPTAGVGALTATSANVVGSLGAAMITTGPLAATTTTVTSLTADGGVSAVALSSLDLIATRNVVLPGMTAATDGGVVYTAAPSGAGTIKSACATVATAVSLSALNTAATVTTISSVIYAAGAPCWVVAPQAGFNASVTYSCRLAAGSATVYAVSGLVGLSAATGSFCVYTVLQ